MLQIFQITAPIFLLIGLGYAAAMSGLLSREQVRGIGTFVITFAMPALLIKTLGSSPIQQTMIPGYLLAYALGSLATFWLAFAVSRWLRRDGLSGCAINAMGMSVSNSGFIGYPLVAAAIGTPAVLGMAMAMLVENLLLIPMALVLAEAGKQQGGGLGTVLRMTFGRLLRNPIIVGIVIGLGVSLLGIEIPPLLFKPIDMLAGVAAPLALFVIGAGLFGMQARGVWFDAAWIAAGKLILHPLAVLLAFMLLPDVDPVMKAVGVLFACAPMLSIFPILGQRFGLQDRCSATLLVATSLSFLTISVALLLIGNAQAA
ncbi:AEC family transporter [Phytopseudomonas dryadis]|uniref:Permease n=1 Tax=Phytopseudomonas dryadis TaxID=2487520 RepID=A0A4V2KBM0_9GAMM|nr:MULTISPECIES: AEC family transporter [Pseudomonas]TBU87097.1 permease [Pseudomonas dryadis]TBV09474.1 permease [Pseudomonas dryadis]TBV13387.1 permease [Pseudomonas sp. FRB 230]